MPNDIDLGERLNDAKLSSPEQVLRRLLAQIESGEVVTKKLVLVFQYDMEEESDYHLGFRNAGMFMSEAVTMLECGKMMALEDMGFA